MTATESQATADLGADSPAYGPQPPALGDLYAAQDAPLEAGLGNAEYDRLIAERIQTEAAYLDAYDRDLVRAVSAPTAADLEAATATTAAAIETGDLAAIYRAAAAEEALYTQVFTGPCDTPEPEPEMEATL